MNNIDNVQFDPAEYISQLVVKTDDEDYKNIMKRAEITHLIYTNAYVIRADFFGQATSMENQMRWIGGTLLPNKERKLSQLRSRTGILREDDQREYKFANETLPHVHSEISIDDLEAQADASIQDLRYTLRVCAISFVVAVREHDAVSHQMDLPTFSAIKAKYSAKQGKSNAPKTVKLEKL